MTTTAYTNTQTSMPQSASIYTKVTTPQTGQSPGASPFGQVTSGPAAAAIIYLYKVMSIYEELMVLANQQTQTEIQIAGLSSQAAARATQAAAHSQALATRDQAGMEIAGAALSIGGTIAMSSGTKKLYDEATGWGAKSTEFENNRTALLNPGPAGTQNFGAQANPSADQVQGRINKLITTGKLDDADLRQGETKEDAVKGTIAHMDDAKRQQFLDTLNQKQRETSNNQNNAYARLSPTQTTIQNYQSVLTNTVNTACTFDKASNETDQGESNAASTVANNNVQMAMNMEGNTAAEISKKYDAQLQELQMLAQIAQNSQVHG